MPKKINPHVPPDCLVQRHLANVIITRLLVSRTVSKKDKRVIPREMTAIGKAGREVQTSKGVSVLQFKLINTLLLHVIEQRVVLVSCL
jgi:hypothetical protein